MFVYMQTVIEVLLIKRIPVVVYKVSLRKYSMRQRHAVRLVGLARSLRGANLYNRLYCHTTTTGHPSKSSSSTLRLQIYNM